MPKVHFKSPFDDVTIDAVGLVQEVSIAQSGGLDFDQAADAAVRKWKFAPALRDGAPFAAHIRVPFLFQPPVQPAGASGAHEAAAPPPASPQPEVKAVEPPPPASPAAAVPAHSGSTNAISPAVRC